MMLCGKMWAMILLTVVISVTARPEEKIEPETPRQIQQQPIDRETRSFSSFPREGSDALKPEHRSLEEVKQLEYYGGAKGQYLIIHPSGQMFISRGETREKEENNESEEEDVGMEEGGTQGGGGGSDSVTIKPPPDNASIAEAKPVGLAIAGPGGVAASRPSATAVVGPGGLAIARPIATAIAGVGGGNGPPIVVSPAAGHSPTGPLPPSNVPAQPNAIQTNPYIPQFYYQHPAVVHPQTQQVFLYPLGYLNPHGRQHHA